MWNPWNVLTRTHRKKKGQILYIADRSKQITTSAKLLDIAHKSYGFNADLIEAIN